AWPARSIRLVRSFPPVPAAVATPAERKESTRPPTMPIETFLDFIASLPSDQAASPLLASRRFYVTSMSVPNGESALSQALGVTPKEGGGSRSPRRIRGRSAKRPASNADYDYDQFLERFGRR